MEVIAAGEGNIADARVVSIVNDPASICLQMATESTLVGACYSNQISANNPRQTGKEVGR